MTLKKGDIRTIYQDPLTCKKPEGKAVLVRRRGEAVLIGDNKVESWWVRFAGENETVPRDIMVPATVVSWGHLKPNQIKTLEKLHREHGRTYNCNACPFYRGQASPYPGTRTPGTFGKCIHREGPCQTFVPRFGIGGWPPNGWLLQVVNRKIIATGPAGQVKILNHVKELVGEINFSQEGV